MCIPAVDAIIIFTYVTSGAEKDGGGGEKSVENKI